MIINDVFKIYRQKTTFWLTIGSCFLFRCRCKENFWVIQTSDSIVEQNKEYVEIYKDKVTDLQSKYVTLHVGLFWGIGVFIFYNEDTVKIKLNEKTMYNQLTSDSKIEDEFIKNECNPLDS